MIPLHRFIDVSLEHDDEPDWRVHRPFLVAMMEFGVGVFVGSEAWSTNPCLAG